MEARDNRGTGNRATVPFTLFVLDVNDNVPRFLKNPMDFILGPEGYNFSQRAFIKVGTLAKSKTTIIDADNPAKLVGRFFTFIFLMR